MCRCWNALSIWLVYFVLAGLPRQLESTENQDAEHLRVMQFNIWLDGSQVPFGVDRIADVIAAAKADVVTLSEARQKENPFFVALLKDALALKGLEFFGEHPGGDVAVLSRWPIHTTKLIFNRFKLGAIRQIEEDRGSIVVSEIQSPTTGRRLLVASAHLDWQDYALYLPRGYEGNSPFAKVDGPNTNTSAMEALERASTRLPALIAFMNHLRSDERLRELPVILGGDFNDGSHLDWTKSTGGFFDHHEVVYDFPSSKLLENIGFKDAWRHVLPDAAQHPGTTWPSESQLGTSTSWAKTVDERDRLDYIYFRCGKDATLEAKNVSLGGSKFSYAHNKLAANEKDPFMLSDMRWPSDHKAVIADFQFASSGAIML